MDPATTPTSAGPPSHPEAESARKRRLHRRLEPDRATHERSGLGTTHHLTVAFTHVRYGLSVITSNTPDSAWEAAFVRGMREAIGYIDAAIYELGLLTGGDEPVDQRAYDPELWEHVRGLVEAEEWGKVASQTAIFSSTSV